MIDLYRSKKFEIKMGLLALHFFVQSNIMGVVRWRLPGIWLPPEILLNILNNFFNLESTQYDLLEKAADEMAGEGFFTRDTIVNDGQVKTIWFGQGGNLREVLKEFLNIPNQSPWTDYVAGMFSLLSKIDRFDLVMVSDLYQLVANGIDQDKKLAGQLASRYLEEKINLERQIESESDPLMVIVKSTVNNEKIAYELGRQAIDHFSQLKSKQMEMEEKLEDISKYLMKQKTESDKFEDVDLAEMKAKCKHYGKENHNLRMYKSKIEKELNNVTKEKESLEKEYQTCKIKHETNVSEMEREIIKLRKEKKDALKLASDLQNKLDKKR